MRVRHSSFHKLTMKTGFHSFVIACDRRCMNAAGWFAVGVFASVFAGCTGRALVLGIDAQASDVATDASTDAPMRPVQVRMDFTHADGFFAGPFPSEERRLANGHIDLHDFPPGRGAPIVTQLLSVLHDDADGFGATSVIAFGLTGPIDSASLPDPHHSLDAASPVVLIGVDRNAPDYLRRYPVRARFDANAGPYGGANLLTLLPYQGIPLREGTLYAAVVLRPVRDLTGRPLEIAPNTEALVHGSAVAGLTADAAQRYADTLTALDEAHVSRDDIAGLTVFRTGTPTARMRSIREDVLARALPTVDAAFVRDEVFPEYCVYHSTIAMPVFQGGTPPFTESGGGWVFDANGHAVLQRTETARIVVTVPRRAMPANGFPTAVLVRTGAGGDRPLVDRGAHGVAHGPSLVPGSGYAQDFAHAGFAGVTVDGPLGGLRNPTGGDEQFLVFNVANPLGLRDNIRQSALELVLLAHVLEGLHFDPSDCDGVVSTGDVRFDTGTLALMGHSMGATIAPLALAMEPRYRAAILSGAGGSWIENVMFKQRPVAVRPAMEQLLRYASIHRALDDNDVALSLLQWAGEPADPPLYARNIVHEPILGAAPRDVLMVQGIVDTYILPPIAYATTLSAGFDFAGTPLDASESRLAMFASIDSVLSFSGRRVVSYPVRGNEQVTGFAASTAVTLQAREDGIEDGHEVVFQTEGPKHQVICFLESFARGQAEVVAPGAEFAPCSP